MRMKRGGHFRVFFQNAPEDGAADADDFGFHIRHRAGETSGLGDERHFPQYRAGADRADRDPPFITFMKQGNRAGNDDIGAIGTLALAEKLASRTQDKPLRTEGKQAQLFGRERLEQAHRAENANIVV